MSEEKVYVMPATYEEAVARKKELLEKINAYNEAIFSGGELPYSDEEIDELQEEYQILNDRLKLTKEEKISKLDEKDIIVNEDGTVERRKSFLDHIHWPIYIYSFILLFFALGLFSYKMTYDIIVNFVYKRFEIAYNHNITTGSNFVASEYSFNEFWYGALLVLNSVWVQLSAVLLAWVGYILYACFKKDSKKAALIVAIVISVVAVVSIIFVIIKSFDQLYSVVTSQEELYDSIVYSKQMSQYYGY